MKGLFLALVLVTTVTAFAGTKRYFLDPKFPRAKVVDKQTFTNPVAASTTYIKDDLSGNTGSTAVTITSFAAQPDVPRNITVTPSGSTGNIGGCVITISGTDIKNASISETFSFATDSTAGQPATGSKAFKTVSSIAFPAGCEKSPYGATFDAGGGEKLGLDRCMDNAGDVFMSLIDGAKEATGPTMAASTSVVSNNTADFNGTMNGSADFVLYYIQNYQCD